MKNKIDKQNVIYLHPGNAVITNKSKVIYTVLGSCVAITMHIPRLRIAAIAHCLMPTPGTLEKCDCSNCPNKFKYISCAIPLMLELLQKYSFTLNEIDIKIFGGANLILPNGNGKASNTIGQQNINLAKKTIEETNLEIKSFDTGGNMGRKIYFHSENGEVHLKRIKKTEIEKAQNISTC